jgi:hypothetical protein
MPDDDETICQQAFTRRIASNGEVVKSSIPHILSLYFERLTQLGESFKKTKTTLKYIILVLLYLTDYTSYIEHCLLKDNF